MHKQLSLSHSLLCLYHMLTFLKDINSIENSVDPDQLASEEAS